MNTYTKVSVSMLTLMLMTACNAGNPPKDCDLRLWAHDCLDQRSDDAVASKADHPDDDDNGNEPGGNTDPPNSKPTGPRGNRSGLADGTNPGKSTQDNGGTLNPHK